MLPRALISLFVLIFSAFGAGDALDRARQLYARTMYDEALRLLLPASEKPGPVLELIGKSYFMKNDFKKATEFFEAAVQANPSESGYVHWLGKTYGRRAETASILAAPGYASKARQNFEKAVQLDPRNGDALNDLFEYYLQAPGFMGGGIDKAAGLIDRIAALDPVERHYAQARLAEQKKEFQTAEAQLRRAAELAPMQVGRLIDLGKFLAKRGKVQESEAAFERAAKISPNSPKILIEHAEVLIEGKRDLTTARQLLEKYLQSQITPDDRPKEEARKMLAKLGA
jgi:Flp pilus assembly protein TadD